MAWWFGGGVLVLIALLFAAVAVVGGGGRGVGGMSTMQCAEQVWIRSHGETTTIQSSMTARMKRRLQCTNDPDHGPRTNSSSGANPLADLAYSDSETHCVFANTNYCSI